MKSLLKPLNEIKYSKRERERRVLLGLVELYIRTGRPVGSKSLQEAGFDDLSSATIRNYFAKLEQLGYLQQLHASAGRIPTALAYSEYAKESKASSFINKEAEAFLKSLKDHDTPEINRFLEDAAEQLSLLSQTAVFLSTPRFDSDFILTVKLVTIDIKRYLCVMITDFGVIKTEVLHSPVKLNSLSLKRIEDFFQAKLHGHNDFETLTDEEAAIADSFYNEVMLRYLVAYTHFSHEELYSKGFSQLLHYPDYPDVAALNHSLALFEDQKNMRSLLNYCLKEDSLQCLIGEDLKPFMRHPSNAAVIIMPYRIHNKSVGAVGLLGPLRLPYNELFTLLEGFTHSISSALTRKVYKFKISYRHPHEETLNLDGSPYNLLPDSKQILLEDKR